MNFAWWLSPLIKTGVLLLIPTAIWLYMSDRFNWDIWSVYVGLLLLSPWVIALVYVVGYVFVYIFRSIWMI